MPRALWPLTAGRPTIEVRLPMLSIGQSLTQVLLADTGAGSRRSGFEIILPQDIRVQCNGATAQPVTLGGAYSGTFPVFVIQIQIPVLGFDRRIRTVGVPSIGSGLDGLACFRFLSRFTYGNFGVRDQFGLEA